MSTWYSSLQYRILDVGVTLLFVDGSECPASEASRGVRFVVIFVIRKNIGRNYNLWCVYLMNASLDGIRRHEAVAYGKNRT